MSTIKQRVAGTKKRPIEPNPYMQVGQQMVYTRMELRKKALP